ncbi:TPA: phage tail protein [Salmonella enterica]|nr:phage tail protein [Salmonella enterica]
MFYVDNPTGVPVMPPVAAVSSLTTLYFTEGGNGIPPTYPGPDWFNIIQSELLEILRQANIKPDKNTTDQIMTALKKLFITNSGSAGAIAGLTGQNNTFPYFTGKDTMALTPLSAFVRGILGKNDAGEFIKAIGLSADTLSSKGQVAALSNNTQGTVGLQMYEAYNNDYPTPYGNVLHLKGATASGEGELLIGWSGTGGAHAPVYIRSRRDAAEANWSEWAQVFTSKDNFNAATATKLQTARKINGVPFDGSRDITLSAGMSQHDADARYLQNLQRGAPVSPGKIDEYGPAEAPVGCFLSNCRHDATTRYGVLTTYRPLQMYINNAWRTING